MKTIGPILLAAALFSLAAIPFGCSGNSPTSSSLQKTATPTPGTGGASTAAVLAMDGSDNLYVLDEIHGQIKVYSGGTLSRTITGFTIPSFPGIDLHQAREIAVDGAGNIFVIMEGKLVEFDTNGQFIRQIAQTGNGPSDLSVYQAGLVIDRARGTVLVGNYKWVLAFDTQGNYLGNFGNCPATQGGFITLRAIGVDSNGCVYGNDNGNRTLNVWCPCSGGPAGCYLAVQQYTYLAITNAGAVYNPVIDSNGDLFAACHLVTGQPDVMIRFNQGLGTNTSWVINPPSDPTSTALDSQGNVYQAYFNGLVVRFTNTGSSATTIVAATQ